MEVFFLVASATAPNDLIKTIRLRTRCYSPVPGHRRFADRLGQYIRREHIIPFTTAAIPYFRGHLCKRPREGGSK
jgi:hypothetical protein